MPGTIHVSVLDLMDLPPSSSSSAVSVKVAMGKREYQTWDKGEFLFPLTTLRNNLIVTLRDAKGNEISQTDVRTLSIVEKGVWDDLFPLSCGGKLHMKLQFILNEEERKRIQDMRESVARKKQEQIKKSNIHTQTATNGESAFVEPVEDLIFPPVTKPEDSESGHGLQDNQSVEMTPDGRGDLSAAHLLQEHSSESDAFHLTGANLTSSEGSPHTNASQKHGTLMEDLDLQLEPSLSTILKKNTENHSHTDAPQKHGSLVEDSGLPLEPSGSTLSGNNTKSHSLGSSVEGEDTTHISRTDTSTKKVPSNVRKMISTFESGLVQGQRPAANPLNETQLNKIQIRSYLKNPQIEESNNEKSKFIQQDMAPRVGSFSMLSHWEVNLLQSPNHMELVYAKEPIDSVKEEQDLSAFYTKNGSYAVPTLKEDKAFEEKSVLETHPEGKYNASGRDPVGLDSKQVDMFGAKQHPVEEVTTSGNASFGLSMAQQESSGTMIDNSGCETCGKNSDNSAIHGASNEKAKLLIEHCAYEIPGSWIFQDETRHLCITTADRKVRNIVGACRIYCKTHPRKINLDRTIEREICKPRNARNTKAKSSASVQGNGGGMIEQAIRIAIIVACGTIFYNTRQRQPGR